MNRVTISHSECLDIGRETTGAIDKFADSIAAARSEPVLFGFDPDVPESDVRRSSEALLGVLGESIAVFEPDNKWFKLQVKIDASPERTHGISENPLHIDYIDREIPPSYIGLLCVRQDPYFGGLTQLASLVEAARAIRPQAREILSESFFRYWADPTAYNVGPSLPSFSVLGHDWHRFSAKMIPHLVTDSPVLVAAGQKHVKEIRAALLEFYEALLATRTSHRLIPGDFLIFPQHVYAHGRSALGYGQEFIEDPKRRLLLQIYGRDRSTAD
jgi:hypothetical protein